MKFVIFFKKICLEIQSFHFFKLNQYVKKQLKWG